MTPEESKLADEIRAYCVECGYDTQPLDDGKSSLARAICDLLDSVSGAKLPQKPLRREELAAFRMLVREMLIWQQQDERQTMIDDAKRIIDGDPNAPRPRGIMCGYCGCKLVEGEVCYCRLARDVRRYLKA